MMIEPVNGSIVELVYPWDSYIQRFARDDNTPAPNSLHRWYDIDYPHLWCTWQAVLWEAEEAEVMRVI